MNINAIAVAIQSGVPQILWGKPGGGKTAWINSLAQSLKLPLEVFIAAIHEPSDLAIPMVVNGEVSYHPGPCIKRLVANGGGIFFCDEASTAPPAMQNALLRVIHERWAGDQALPPSTLFVLAANPVETTTGAWMLNAPFANRNAHWDWQVATEQWIEGMAFGWEHMYKNLPRLEKGWESLIPVERQMIASFIRVKPSLLNAQPDDQEQSGRAWPSGRSWDNAAKMRAAGQSVGLSEEAQQEMVAACVGVGAAVEYITWKTHLDLPLPEDMIANPRKIVLPRRDDQLFAALAGMVSYAIDKLNKKKWEACWTILERAAHAGKGDIAVLPSKALLDRRGELALPDMLVSLIPILQQAAIWT